MLVDLRASVDAALGKGAAEGEAAPQKASAAAAGAGGAGELINATGQSQTKSPKANVDAPEFEISAAPPEWDADAESQPGKKK
jgi:hypothetical protein